MMNETERLLAQARKDCPDCHGTGIIEGAMHPACCDEHMTDAWTRDADKICHCVPIMIIHAVDDDDDEPAGTEAIKHPITRYPERWRKRKPRGPR